MDAIPDNITREDDEPDAAEIQGLLLRMMRGINGQAFRVFGDRVHAGPFAGMVIPERTPHWDDGNAVAKLLGSYEIELRETLSYAVWRRPKVIVNIGCAEGYYAIGLARIVPEAKVYAFDTNLASLDSCRAYAQLNDVEITLAQGCGTPAELRILQEERGHRLYVIDCEGDESKLIDMDRCPELQRSDIIVECHDFLQQDTSLLIAERLSQTHRVELIRPRVPDLTQYGVVTRNFPAIMAALMIVEKRPLWCCWLACWSNRKG
jgi:hypothetical protein